MWGGVRGSNSSSVNHVFPLALSHAISRIKAMSGVSQKSGDRAAAVATKKTNCCK